MPARVVGTPASAALEILRSAIDLESNQRGFFLSVPEYRERFAYESIREAFALEGIAPQTYEQLRQAILKRNQKPELVFQLDWRVSPKSEPGKESYRLVSASGSSWEPSILQWIPVPEDEGKFRSALREQLNVLYRSITRRRTLEEILSQQFSACLQKAMIISPAEVRREYQQSREVFRAQQTVIRLEIIKGSESRLRGLIQEMAVIQKQSWDQFTEKNPKPTRAQLSLLRQEVLAIIRGRVFGERWESHQLYWPVREETRERDLGGLSSEQQEFALRAPLGQVLLPNTFEIHPNGEAELWILSDEGRGEIFQIPETDPEVTSILKNRIQTRDYIHCAKRWFSAFRRERLALEPGVQITETQWDSAVTAMMGGR